MGWIQKAFEKDMEIRKRKLENLESEARHPYAKISDKVDGQRKLGHTKSRKSFKKSV